MAPLLPGMESPPHPMRLGNDEKDYYVRAVDSGSGPQPDVVGAAGRAGQRGGDAT